MPAPTLIGASLISDLSLSARSGAVHHQGKHWADFEFPLAGEYNVWNATAAAALAAGCGIPKDQIAAALQKFKSVKRRLEVRAQVDGITVIDDFAHHPDGDCGHASSPTGALSSGAALGDS